MADFKTCSQSLEDFSFIRSQNPMFSVREKWQATRDNENIYKNIFVILFLIITHTHADVGIIYVKVNY